MSENDQAGATVGGRHSQFELEDVGRNGIKRRSLPSLGPALRPSPRQPTLLLAHSAHSNKIEFLWTESVTEPKDFLRKCPDVSTTRSTVKFRVSGSGGLQSKVRTSLG